MPRIQFRNTAFKSKESLLQLSYLTHKHRMANEYRTKVRAQQQDLPAPPGGDSQSLESSEPHGNSPDLSDMWIDDTHVWIKASLPEDSPCLLTGVAVVGHYIVVCDNENKTVKVFRVDGKFKEELFLTDPCGICVLPNSTNVAITEPEIKQITICSLEGDIELKFSIKHEKKYQCITTHTDTYMVGCSDIANPCIDFINNDGTILRTIDRDAKGERIFRNPTSLACLQSGEILISDPGTSSIICLKADGQVRYRLESQGRPSAVYGDVMGRLYMAHYDSNEVYRLQSSGAIDSSVVDQTFKLKHPLAMCVLNDWLVVTEETPSDRILVVKVPQVLSYSNLYIFSGHL